MIEPVRKRGEYPNSSPALAEFLHELRARAGKPSHILTGKAIQYSHTTVRHTINGETANWTVIERLLSFYGATGDEIKKARLLWSQANTNWEKRTVPEHQPKWALDIVEELRAVRTLLEKFLDIQH